LPGSWAGLGGGPTQCHPLLCPGLAGPLQWLQNSLRRAAEDREEEGERAGEVGKGRGGGVKQGHADSTACPGLCHPVPLVPLSEENEEAMEDSGFRRLLRQLGLRPPANEQESFWRIPAALSPQQLRRLAASIAQRAHDPPGCPQGLLEPPQ
ncbi:TIM protein, partial [Ramphastos sulfuratus]|nr:TIM protein [Ramphastos sulfuratus]